MHIIIIEILIFLKVDKVQLEDCKDSNKFILKSKDSSSEEVFILQSHSIETAQEWRDKINFVLSMQIDYVKCKYKSLYA